MGKEILLAESDPQVITLVKSLLEGKDHLVTHRASGKEALDEVKMRAFDLAIVGEQMTDIDGIGWIVKLRQVSGNLKVVFISKQWRDAELYQQLTKEFKVSLIVHRPIKAGLFGTQIEGLFAVTETVMTPGTAQEEETFQNLKRKYVRVLPERLSALEKAMKDAREKPNEELLLSEARRLAHNLKGTSSSCGFEQLGESAKHLEHALNSMMQSKLAEHEDAWSEIDLIYGVVKVNADKVTACEDDGAATEEEEDAASVRVLVVCNDAVPEVERDNNGLPLRIISSSNTEEALDKARDNSLDAVLIDIDVEKPSPSLALAREMRGLPGYETLPVAFVSTRAEASDLGETTHAGASLHLPKPLKSKMLNEAIDYLVAIRQGGRSRVLIVDDDPDFASIISTALGREGMLVRVVHDPTNLLSVLEEYQPDLMLLDVMMPMVSGFDVCRMVRASAQWQDLPILFLTAQTGLDARLAAFDAGGDDYLPKPVATVELLTRVKVRLERARLLKERADKDILSGLLIRRAFMEQVKSMHAESVRHNLVYSLSLLDIDHFKKVNDTYGHLAGDRVLAAVGQLLKKRFRVEDIRGRWGGEEFIIAFRHVNKETAKGALERALEELKSISFEGDHGEKFSVSFSAGLVSFPEDGEVLEELIKVSDTMLYKSKEAGRSRVTAAVAAPKPLSKPEQERDASPK